MKTELSPRAFRDLGSFEKRTAGRILEELAILESPRWPGPPKIRKLTSPGNIYRLRVGEYRIIYEVQKRIAIILRIVARKDLEKALRNL